jgi:phage terminase small subunit
MEKQLTVKQRTFADRFIANGGNASQAALDAGYSKKTARVIGAQNLTKLNIKAYIDERLEQLRAEAVADQQEVLEFLTRLIRRQEMEQVVVTLKKPVVLPMRDKEGNEYSKFAYEDVDDVVDVPTKNSDSVRAVEILARIQGMGKNANKTLVENQARKMDAEATIAEHRAKEVTGEGEKVITTINFVRTNRSVQQDGNDGESG